jgi:uncharacterized protein (TIGR02284 family)
MRKTELIGKINHLVEICLDGQRGFNTCAEDVQNDELKKVFAEAADRCGESAQALQMEVQRLGGDPQQGGSLGGTVHRAWVDIKAAISGKDEAAILAECERGEDLAITAYRNVLVGDLPDDIRPLIEKQFRGVKKNHELITRLRDRYRQEGHQTKSRAS